MLAMKEIDAKGLKANIAGMINWPTNYHPLEVLAYTDRDEERIVITGIFFTEAKQIGEGAGLRCIGRFVADRTLNPLMGIWDGKKAGAIHKIVGKVVMFDYQFDSDEANPLVFVLTKDGYQYSTGKGTVIDLKSGTKYGFPTGR
jgi:hypothetical protein